MKLYYRSNNPTISSPFNLSNVQPDRRCRDFVYQSSVSPPLQSLFKPSEPLHLPTLPMLAAWPQPYTTPTWSQNWLFQLFCSPQLCPPPCTQVSPKHTILLPTPTSFFCVLLCEAVAALMQKETLNTPERLHLFCIQRILGQKSMKNSRRKKTPNTSETQNLFQVLIRTIFKLLVTETWRKAGLYSRQK